MTSKTIKATSTEDIIKEIDQVTSDGFKPTLAIVFLSVKQDYQAVSDLLDERNIAIFGATTSGEFINEDIEEGSIAMMLLDMNPAYFKLEFLETTEQTAREDARKLGYTGKTTFTNPAYIITTGGISIDGEHVVEGIGQGFENASSSLGNAKEYRTNQEMTLFGGKAGDDLILDAPFVFTNQKSSGSALVALIIDEDKIDVRGIATCGWKAIGTSKTVTKSEANTIYTIDDKPALDMLLKYLGIEIKFDVKKEIVSLLSSWYYPLQLERENAEPVIRSAMFANCEDRSIICAGNVPQGTKIKFSMPPDFDSIDTVVAECESIKDTPQEQVDALIMFSCVSRHLAFGVLMKEELEQVQKVWNAPMIGFFTYGEYGKSKTGKNEYHNNTCCIVALKEK